MGEKVLIAFALAAALCGAAFGDWAADFEAWKAKAAKDRYPAGGELVMSSRLSEQDALAFIEAAKVDLASQDIRVARQAAFATVYAYGWLGTGMAKRSAAKSEIDACIKAMESAAGKHATPVLYAGYFKVSTLKRCKGVESSEVLGAVRALAPMRGSAVWFSTISSVGLAHGMPKKEVGEIAVNYLKTSPAWTVQHTIFPKVFEAVSAHYKDGNISAVDYQALLVSAYTKTKQSINWSKLDETRAARVRSHLAMLQGAIQEIAE